MKLKAIIPTFSILLLLVCSASAAVTNKVSLEVAAGDTMNDILQRNVGQFVEVKLLSGETISGRLVRTNPNLVHISKITGRNYFDAVIRVDQVSALIVQVNQ